MSWRSFWKGRRYGGNIGHPSDSKGFLRSEDNEDLWFTQKLDHSDPMNVQTWKQVDILNSIKRTHKNNPQTEILCQRRVFQWKCKWPNFSDDWW